MAPPRSIKGRIGTRIRVTLGDDGNSWLLLLDNDDGNRKWQSTHWKSIPKGMAKRINNCTSKGRCIKYADFGPNNSWYVNGLKADGSGGHSCGGLDSKTSAVVKTQAANPHPCKVALGSRLSRPSFCLISGNSASSCTNVSTRLSGRLKQNHNRSGRVDIIRLFSDGQFYMKDDKGVQWKLSNNIPLAKELKKHKKVEDVAVAGDGSWIVIRSGTFVSSSGIDTTLTEIIRDFFRRQQESKRKRQQEIKEYYDREKAEREGREVEERRTEEKRERRSDKERKAAEESRATISEVKLVEKLTQEKESIDKLETRLTVMQDHLVALQDHFSTMQGDVTSRKRSLRESIGALPPAQRPRWDLGEDKPSRQKENPQCVICQGKAPVRAVVPCGHVCLCDDCAPSISQRPSNHRFCPLCRGPAPSTLRIYW